MSVSMRSGTKTRYLLDAVFTTPLPDADQYLFTHPNKVPADVLDRFLKAPLLALDFETKGNDISDPEFRAVGVSVSDGEKALYVGLKTVTPKQKRRFLLQLARRPLIMHNAYFDNGVFRKELGKFANVKWCTFGLSKQLSSESQELRWGLKGFQKELLGWTETNELELDQWLVTHGYTKGTAYKTELVAIKDPETKEVTRWVDPPTKRYKGLDKESGEDRWFVADKGQMWNAPNKILGKYCNLDAYSTYLLFDRVLRPAMLKVDYEALRDYHYNDFLISVEILIDNWLQGVTIDKENLETYNELLQKQIQEARTSFLNHPRILPIIQEWRETVISSHRAREPSAKFKKCPTLGKEPNRITKSGTESKNWVKWNEKRLLVRDWETNPENIRSDWKTWKERLVTLTTDPEEAGFNVNSADHLKWLIYEKLGYEPVLFTKSGQPAVSGEAIGQMGPELKDLQTYKDKTKEQGYVQACLDKVRQGSDGLWRLHPQYICPGPLTGRLAGSGGLNVQQLPKSYGYLSCWRPLEADKVWIDVDHTALEPTVITELTRDPGMMKVYGPEARNQDIYLYFGAKIPGLGDKFREAGFDPDAPTKEGKNRAKSLCKPERNICKTVVLAKQYRASVKKIYSTLRLNKVDISYEEVEVICKTYDDTFQKVKEFSWQLEKEWKQRKGFVYNGIGRPMTVAEDCLKDLVNRVVQSTGHDIHMKFMRILRTELKREGIDFTWVIPDFHDQAILQASVSDAENIKQLIIPRTYDILNKELGGLIPISGGPEIVNNLAEAKELKPDVEEETTQASEVQISDKQVS